MPEYVRDVMLARYIGVTTIELDAWPVYRLDQYETVRMAEIGAQNELNRRNKPK